MGICGLVQAEGVDSAFLGESYTIPTIARAAVKKKKKSVGCLMCLKESTLWSSLSLVVYVVLMGQHVLLQMYLGHKLT